MRQMIIWPLVASLKRGFQRGRVGISWRKMNEFGGRGRDASRNNLTRLA